MKSELNRFEDQDAHNCNAVPEAIIDLRQAEDVDVRNFYDRAENKEEKQLCIGFIAYNRKSDILAKISKCIIGYSLLVVGVPAIEKAL